MRRSITRILFGIFVQWLTLLPLSQAMLNGFTTIVEAGKVNCFYENMEVNKTLEMEYQVRVMNLGIPLYIVLVQCPI